MSVVISEVKLPALQPLSPSSLDPMPDMDSQKQYMHSLNIQIIEHPLSPSMATQRLDQVALHSYIHMYM